jgi:hypothetical protein
VSLECVECVFPWCTVRLHLSSSKKRKHQHSFHQTFDRLNQPWRTSRETSNLQRPCLLTPQAAHSSLTQNGPTSFWGRQLTSIGSSPLSFNYQRQEKLGDFELVAGSVSPAQTVKSHSEWVIAYDSALEAMIYVFPHHFTKLAAYRKYVKKFFASFPVS